METAERLKMTFIDQKYAQLGGPSGLLGPAVLPEVLATGGAFRGYQKGIIAWVPATGAHEVHGLILKKWSAFGHQDGLLGFPTTDQSSTPEGSYNLFQRGVILYKRGTSEAFEVHGAIHQKYINLNSEKGILGFPISDERISPPSVASRNLSAVQSIGSLLWGRTRSMVLSTNIGKEWDGKQILL